MEYFIENLLKYINFKNGFYIECGANDGITQSYTYRLEKMGWYGILIEPSSYAFKKCIINRNKNNYFFNCALVASEKTMEISGDFDGSPMASVGGLRLNRPSHTIVPARTLNSILEELNIIKIDLFSLDVEGYELEILKGFDIMKYHPKYILIEVYNKIKNNIFNLLKKEKYKTIDNLTGYDHKTAAIWENSYNDYLFKYYGNC